MYNNYMLDLETTGTAGGKHAMIQVAGFRFGVNKGELDPIPFNACLHVPAWRSWEEGTRHWWSSDPERREIFAGIKKRMQDPQTVMQDLQKWVLESPGKPVLWAKPSHFEFPFIEGYFKDFGMINPFHYRFVNDMNSYIRAIHHPEEAPDIKMPFHGPAHDAVYDALNQIEVVWEHLEIAKQNKENLFRLEQLEK
jgi:hypothetical protein